MARAHLLLVDDEPAILSTLQKALALEGYGVDVAGGIGIAEERIEKRAYDLCIFDVMLPDGDGLDLLARLKKSQPNVPVLMMSGHANIDLAVRATKLGALSFLEKPVNTDALLITVENALRLERAESEAKNLRKQVGIDASIIGGSAAMVELLERIRRAAKSQASVLVTGERGTGKELVARAIHENSPRKKGPLEKLNCAALPSELIESELFGHEAGAFTGATKQRRGKFERANGGTLFLDEVGDMPLAMQAKLLRVLQEKEIERVGGSEVLKVDVRVVAATNRDLQAMCEENTFRADLLDRLNVIPIELPPLRKRRGDIPVLVEHFLERSIAENDRRGVTLADDAMALLSSYSFPGNVRELRNVVERLVILNATDKIDRADVEAALPHSATKASGLYRPGASYKVLVDEAEREILRGAIDHFHGQMAKAARALDLERSHLYKKAKAVGLRSSEKDDADGDDPVK